MAIVATKVFPLAVGAQINNDSSFRRFALTAFSCIGVKVGNLV
jgi:hypothetical protein